MRTIKFRAWDKEKKKIIKSGLVEVFGMEKCSPNYFFMDQALNHIVWMQFTGLLDKNGKEIYEGDVVKNMIGKAIEVVTIPGIFELNHQTVNESSYTFTEQSEVIGNIYEHPELLENVL